MANQLDLNIPVPINKGGTNVTSQSNTGINYFNGTSITSGAVLTFDGLTDIEFDTTDSTAVFVITARGASQQNARFEARRSQSNGNTLTAYTDFTNSISWSSGLFANSNNYEIHDGVGLKFSIANSSGIVNIPSLTASQLTATDGSKNLVSGNLTGDITSSAFATTLATVNSNVGSFGSATQVGTFTVNGKGLITAASNVTITGTTPGGSAGGDLTGTYPNPTLATNAVSNAKFRQSAATSVVGNSTGSTANVADIASSSNGQVLRQASGTLGFGSLDLSQSATVGSSVLPIANGGSNNSVALDNAGIVYFDGTKMTTTSFVTMSGAGITLGNATYGFQDNLNQDRYRLLNHTNGSKIASSGVGSTFSFDNYAGLFTTAGGGVSTGQFTWLTVDGTGAAWAQRMSLSNSGVLNISSLSASLPVFTDSSKNLTSTGTVPATSGGTGQSSYAVGDLLYASTTTALSKLADVATGNALISGGVSTAPSWGKIGLTTHVSGTLPIANGGTNSNSLSAPAGGVNPIMYYNGTSITETTNFGYEVANDILRINSNLANPIVSVATSVTGSPNSASIALMRGDQANGGTFEYHYTGVSLKWQNGVFSGADDYVFKNPGTAILTLGNSTTDVTVNTGNLIINNAGKTLKVKQGSNACAGTGATMVGGTVTVNTTAIATGDIVLLEKTAAGGVSTTGMPVVTIVNGTSFTITGGGTDTSTFSWFFLKAA